MLQYMHILLTSEYGATHCGVTIISHITTLKKIDLCFFFNFYQLPLAPQLREHIVIFFSILVTAAFLTWDVIPDSNGKENRDTLELNNDSGAWTCMSLLSLLFSPSPLCVFYTLWTFLHSTVSVTLRFLSYINLCVLRNKDCPALWTYQLPCHCPALLGITTFKIPPCSLFSTIRSPWSFCMAKTSLIWWEGVNAHRPNLTSPTLLNNG